MSILSVIEMREDGTFALAVDQTTELPEDFDPVDDIGYALVLQQARGGGTFVVVHESEEE